MFEFQDQVVIVTGSGSPKGIGRTIARTFAKQGAVVIIADMNEEGIKDTVAVIEEEGGKAMGITVNVTSPESVQQMADTIMEKYGRIVNLSSVSGKRGGGVFGGAHYSASKAAVLAFSKNLSREISAEGITINSVCPGLINTEIWKSLPKEDADKVIDGIPMGRPGETQEVANAILFLASREASYITGEEIDVNGGSHMD